MASIGTAGMKVPLRDGNGGLGKVLKGIDLEDAKVGDTFTWGGKRYRVGEVFEGDIYEPAKMQAYAANGDSLEIRYMDDSLTYSTGSSIWVLDRAANSKGARYDVNLKGTAYELFIPKTASPIEMWNEGGALIYHGSLNPKKIANPVGIKNRQLRRLEVRNPQIGQHFDWDGVQYWIKTITPRKGGHSITAAGQVKKNLTQWEYWNLPFEKKYENVVIEIVAKRLRVKGEDVMRITVTEPGRISKETEHVYEAFFTNQLM